MCLTAAPNATRMNRKVLERQRNKVGFFCVCFLLFLLIFFGGVLNKRKLWRDWEVSEIGMCSVKSPKNP